MLRRLPDWQSGLSSFLIRHQHTPFAYGRWDCCLFVCDAIEIMTGVDIAAPFRGAYSSQKTARAFGTVESIAEWRALAHGMPETPLARARRGDMVLILRGRRPSLALVDLNGAEVITTSEMGLWRLPLSFAVRCWHV